MDNKPITFKLSARVTSILITLIGVALYLLSFPITETTKIPFPIFIKEVLGTLGPTIISAGCVSLVLEISTIKVCIEDSIYNLIKGKLPLEHYPEEVVEAIQEKLIGLKCGKSIDIDETIYKFEPYLRSFLTKPYYDFHSYKYIVTPKQGFLHKSVQSRSTIINQNLEENYFTFSWTFISDSGLDIQNHTQSNIRIKKFTVNGTDCKAELISSCEVTKHEDIYDKFPFRVLFSYNLTNYATAEIEFDYEYTVEESDMTQSFKLAKPCRKFTHEIYIDGSRSDDWSLSVNAFTAFYANGSPLERKYLTEAKTNKVCKISFDDWTLPGAGYVITFIKK